MSDTAVPSVIRVRPPEHGSERDTMVGLLDFLRATAVNKVAGLSDGQAFSRPFVVVLAPARIREREVALSLPRDLCRVVPLAPGQPVVMASAKFAV